MASRSLTRTIFVPLAALIVATATAAAAPATPAITSPGLVLSEPAGLLGRTITVTGSGFGPGETIELRWRTEKSKAVATTRSRPDGTFSAAFALPDAPDGVHLIIAFGTESGRKARSTYAVHRPPMDTHMVATGVYDVYATRIGLVGGVTSSGHRVRPEDHFVALPACTATSCPNGTAHGPVVACGDRCFVRVTNLQTKSCRVEPVLDVGPWFRVDDWWNPANVRYLNTLPANLHELPQGYPASEAALAGYGVGYGVGPTGRGQDDTGARGGRPVREVGNRAAIDLADGTWHALGLVSDGTGTDVRIELLWQSGADPADAAGDCGHSLAPPVEATPMPG